MQVNSDGTHISLRQEEFSYAYIKSIASVAGYSAESKTRIMDNAGLDISIEVPGEIYDFLSPAIDAQVKCTSRDVVKNGIISYSLDSRTYNRLAHQNPSKPQILIIVLVPKDLSSWMSHGIKKSRVLTMLRASAYWKSLKGEELATKKTKTVKVPVEQRFTSEVLQDLMSEAAKGIL